MGRDSFETDAPIDVRSDAADPPADGSLRLWVVRIVPLFMFGVVVGIATRWEAGSPYLDRSGLAAVAACMSMLSLGLAAVLVLLEALPSRSEVVVGEKDHSKLRIWHRFRLAILGFLSVAFLVIALIATWST